MTFSNFYRRLICKKQKILFENIYITKGIARTMSESSKPYFTYNLCVNWIIDQNLNSPNVIVFPDMEMLILFISYI